ncbi:putative non-inhibitory serpin-10 [Hordeum vulgare]|nr:putative non-inhibitory serpin-10 [Hordeum vulgare]
MTKTHRGKYYIDNSSWGPEAGSIESGYRVPFGKIHVFIGKVGTPVLEPDTSTDIVEPDRLAQPAARQLRRRRAFVSFTQGFALREEPEAGEDTHVNSDGESSIGDNALSTRGG